MAIEMIGTQAEGTGAHRRTIGVRPEIPCVQEFHSAFGLLWADSLSLRTFSLLPFAVNCPANYGLLAAYSEHSARVLIFNICRVGAVHS